MSVFYVFERVQINRKKTIYIFDTHTFIYIYIYIAGIPIHRIPMGGAHRVDCEQMFCMKLWIFRSLYYSAIDLDTTDFLKGNRDFLKRKLRMFFTESLSDHNFSWFYRQKPGKKAFDRARKSLLDAFFPCFWR